MSECFYPRAFLLIIFLVYDTVSTKFLALSAFTMYLIYTRGGVGGVVCGQNKTQLSNKMEGKITGTG